MLPACIVGSHADLMCCNALSIECALTENKAGLGVVMRELGCVGPHCNALVNLSHGQLWPNVSVYFVAIIFCG